MFEPIEVLEDIINDNLHRYEPEAQQKQKFYLAKLKEQLQTVPTQKLTLMRDFVNSNYKEPFPVKVSAMNKKELVDFINRQDVSDKDAEEAVHRLCALCPDIPKFSFERYGYGK